MGKKGVLRNVPKQTPLGLLQQLKINAKALEASSNGSEIRITRNGTRYTVKDNDGTTVLNDNDKDHRRILLHRIWRWQQKTKWRVKK